MECRAILDFPESTWLDYKQDFPFSLLQQNDCEQAGIGTVLKDLVALANTSDNHGTAYLVYGVKDHGFERKVFGISKQFDDARFQQLARNLFYPIPIFSYHEERIDDKPVGIFEINRTPYYPHVVKRKVKDVFDIGQVFFRQGTQNRVAGYTELKEMFLGSNPFKFRSMSDPELKRITNLALTEGKQISALYLSNRDSYLAQGYKPFYYPETRREIWVGFNNSQYELMIFEKIPS